MAFHVAARTILKEDGLAGLYRGFVPNALKNLPNKGEGGEPWERQQCSSCRAAAVSCPPWNVNLQQQAYLPGVQQRGPGFAACAPTAAPAHPLPATGVKLSVFDGAKNALTTAEQAYDEECRKLGIPPPVREEWRPRGRANGNANSKTAASGQAAKQPAARK